MKLREKVNNALCAYSAATQLVQSGFYSLTYIEESRNALVNEILAAVREAMLAEEVIECVIIAYLNGQPSHGGFVYDIISHALTAAGITESEVE